ncbi:O-antigen ligase family protein [Clostridium lacusfryxellense]|uniref:O-antigen ligase family protein n=1 Tax=Clostridium lacusfryxellense TaxID=205328 RepID=UPI001C0DFCAE|nr:O-antigen ligase family protein [Clostridium lacusfryxellense]MBU3111065.1 O-antigen ligase family protein [Clostridium lacusfryxellense]
MYMRNTFFSGIVYVVIIAEIFFVFEYMSIKGHMELIIKTFYKLTLFYIILTDIIMITMPNLYMQYGGYYLTGNKFNVSYLHLQLIVLFVQKCKIEKKFKLYEKSIFVVLSILTFRITIFVNCSTGMIGLILLLLLLIFSKKMLCKANTILFVLIVSSSFLFLYSDVLSNQYVQYFIENVLHKSITLTGRMNIYTSLFSMLKNQFLFGYGFGSSYEVCTRLISAVNTQNGLLECILEQGIISTCLLLILIYLVFKQSEKYSIRSTFCFPAVVMIYVYSLLSSVEVTLNTSYLIWIAMIYATCISNTKSKVS